ncbi:MAG TPA: hypothetical protein VK611_18575 [Acidimicrobiales bacterium]|nr:hypothetical protein [Acidimicrobiales bacterium]
MSGETIEIGIGDVGDLGDLGDDITAPVDLGGERLELADGVELLGKYQGSGFRTPSYLVKRSDGQVIQVTELIYLVATCLAAGYHLHQVAARITGELDRSVSVENVAYLVNQKLRPAGLIRSVEGATPPSPRASALLTLRMRVPLVPARLHGVVTRALLPLFRAPVVVAGLAGLLALDAWLVLAKRDEITHGVREIIYHPLLVLLITGLTLVAGAFHETGHATAARFGGATPGAMGAGVYLVWPVFYTDVTDSYRLSRKGRLRTDLGGVWFNVLFTLGVAGAYLATGFAPLLVYLVLAQLETLRQFLPFVRLDGYYVISDLAGVPNLFTYMQPVLTTLFRRRDPAALATARAKLDELNPRARKLITGWVAITAPVLLANIVLLVVLLPRLAGAASGSAGSQLRRIAGVDHGFDVVTAANGLVGLCLLAVPVLGMLYISARLLGRVVATTQGYWQSRPRMAAVMTAAASAVAAWQLGFVWPDAFATALQQAQRATVVEIAEPASSESAGSSGGDGGSDTEVAGATPGTRVTDSLGDTRPKPAAPSPQPAGGPAPTDGTTSSSSSTAGSLIPGTSETTGVHSGVRDVDTDRPTAPTTTPPPPAPTTTDPPNAIEDLLEGIFGPHP